MQAGIGPGQAAGVAPAAHPPVAAGGARCRLCHGETEWMFSRSVLGRHDVGYERCLSCGSLQTEELHWLSEACRLFLEAWPPHIYSGRDHKICAKAAGAGMQTGK